MANKESRATDPNGFQEPFNKSAFLETFSRSDQDFMRDMLKSQGITPKPFSMCLLYILIIISLNI